VAFGKTHFPNKMTEQSQHIIQLEPQMGCSSHRNCFLHMMLYLANFASYISFS